MGSRQRASRKQKRFPFVEQYFPEYLIDGEPIFLLDKWGSRFSSKYYTRETSPWRFAPNVADGKTINMQGYIVHFEWISKPPYYAWVKEQVSFDEFKAYCDTLNFFRNGGKAMNGMPGLDPLELVGGHRGFKGPYICPNGEYYAGRRPWFKFYNGERWGHRDVPNR